MADILISKFTTQIPRVGATPATPGFAESEGQDPVAPSGSPLVYTPVTIGSPANGLSIDASQVLTIGLASTSTTGALSSTDWNTFNGKIGGSGTTNYLSKFTGSGTIGDSAVIESGGNVGIGVTPSAWDLTTNSRGLQFGRSGSIFYSTAQAESSFGGNYYQDGVSSYRYLTTSPALRYSLNDFDGSFRWYNSGIGTAETLISFTQAMTLTSSGNLLIGTTSDSGHRLNVNGEARIQSINNLGVSTTSVLVPSATNVVSLRTLAELASDMGVSTDSVQTVSTSGTINDLAITSTTVIFTGASVILNGMSALANSREISISNFTGSNLTINGENTSSLANNRFTGGFTVINNQTVRFKYSTTNNRWNLVGGYFVATLENIPSGFANGIRTDTRTGFNRPPLLNAPLVSRAASSDSTQSALFLDNSSETRIFNAQGSGLIETPGQLIVGGGSSVPLTTYSLWVTSKGNTSSQGTIYLQNTSGSLLTVWDGTGDQRSVGGATFGVQRIPTGRVEIRGKGTSTISTLSLEDSGGTLNALFLDNGRFQLLRLPTSATGLGSGDLWNDNGNVRIGTTVTFRDQESVKTTATADQTLPSGTLTILDYDSTLLNNSTATYTVGTNGRITINTTGIYTITAGVVIEADAVTALESAFLGIFRNGDLVAISSINTTIAAGAQSGLTTSTILSLTATDIIDCRALVNSVGGVANGLARRLGTLLGANATQVNSLSITKNSM